MAYTLERALERLVATVKRQTGIDLSGQIGISNYQPDGEKCRHKLEQISDRNSDCIERHLSVNMNEETMLDALDMCQRLIEIMEPDHYIITSTCSNRETPPLCMIYHDKQEALDAFDTVERSPHSYYYLIHVWQSIPDVTNNHILRSEYYSWTAQQWENTSNLY